MGTLADKMSNVLTEFNLKHNDNFKNAISLIEYNAMNGIRETQMFLTEETVKRLKIEGFYVSNAFRRCKGVIKENGMLKYEILVK